MLASVAVLATTLAMSAVASAEFENLGLVSTGPHGGGCGIFLCGSTYVGGSEDGARVYYMTDEQLLDDDTDSLPDVYERSGGTLKLASTGSIDVPGFFGTMVARVSPDGNSLFFETDDQLVPEDTDASIDVYRRSGGVTTLISTGSSFNGLFDAVLDGASDDGSKVFFQTLEPIGDGDTDAADDIYQYSNGVTTRVSKGESTPGNGLIDVVYEGASKDGAHVFFSTTEALTSDDTDASRIDVYERYDGHTKLVSRTTGTTGSLNGAFDAVFGGATPDGKNVFVMTKEKLATTDTDSSQDVFRRTDGTTTSLVSTGPTNPNGNFDVFFDGVSDDGNRVFIDTTGKLTSDDTDSRLDIYERQVTAATTKVVSTGTKDGNNAVVPIFITNTPDGSHVYFAANDAFTADDTDKGKDIFDRSGTTTTLISAGSAPTDLDICLPPVCGFKATADGSRVFFQTVEGLVPTDLDGQVDVYQRRNGVTTLITTGTGSFDSFLAGVTTDGSHVFFETDESLVDTDTDGVRDLYEATSEPVIVPTDPTPTDPGDPVGTSPTMPGVTSTPAPAGPGALKVKVSSNATQHVLRNRGLSVRIRCDRACGATVSATVSIPGASKALHLRDATGKTSAGVRKTLKLRAAKRARRAIRRALRPRKRLRATIIVTVRANDGGAPQMVKLPVSLIR